MNEHLMEAIIQCAAFFELSGDDIVDPDAAVRELESIASKLQKLNQIERQEFIVLANKYAERERQQGQPKRRIEFIQSLADNLGLT